MTKSFIAPVALPADSTCATASLGDNSTKLASTAFVDRAKHSVIASITGTTQTVGISHLGKFLSCSNASAQTLTIDTDANAAWPDNAQLEGAQVGAGKVSFVGGSGVTIRKRSVFNASAGGQYAGWGLKRIGANEWLLFGDLEPV